MTADDETGPPQTLLSNIERLLQHLPEDSFAGKLVTAAPDAAEGLKRVIADRLNQVRQSLEQS
jgi:hypothetical protein